MTVRGVQLGQRSETVRRANLSTIVRALHIRGPLSRSELVARTGLTRSAIRELIGELVASGLASEGPSAPHGTPGRPSHVVRLEPGRAVVLALEISVDSLAGAVIGLGGTVFGTVRVDRSCGDDSVETVVFQLTELARDMLTRHGGDTLVGVGVAVVGIVRRSDGLVSVAPNLGWHDAALGSRLAASLRLPVPVAVANEADLGALAEHRRGAAIDVENLIFISGEVGVGGGIIAGGLPLTGVAGFGGEIGHLPVNPDGRACRCGAIGCWETEVGETALLVGAGHDPGGGRAAVDAVLREAADSSASARSSLARLAHWLGIGLAGLVNVFNPRLIVLGGRFGRLHPFVCEGVEAELDRRALAGPRAIVSIVPTALGDDAALIGAAELAIEPLLSDPASWLSSTNLRPAEART
ncbi:MAG TPA: ROK family transcriptional regulator [Candidatus Limnocylindrales bacterium]|nr:ROK family transcriptional regulator [Candidatus Limnocylindrales bacterium]